LVDYKKSVLNAQQQVEESPDYGRKTNAIKKTKVEASPSDDDDNSILKAAIIIKPA
jgi:hypothetical protein